MRSSIFLLFVAFLGSFAWGCSGPTDTAKTASKPNVNNPIAPSNQSQTEGPNSAVNTAPTANIRDRRVGGKQTMIDANHSGKALPPQFQPAAENSEWAATMNADGSVDEIRVFRSHPQLAKVEVTWLEPKNKDAKFYLRDGKVLEVRTDRLGSLKTVTTTELLAIAGVK